jgi:hypothetical protein
MQRSIRAPRRRDRDLPSGMRRPHVRARVRARAPASDHHARAKKPLTRTITVLRASSPDCDIDPEMRLSARRSCRRGHWSRSEGVQQQLVTVCRDAQGRLDNEQRK